MVVPSRICVPAVSLMAGGDGFYFLLSGVLCGRLMHVQCSSFLSVGVGRVTILTAPCDILAQDLIGLIEYSYHKDILSFSEAHLQRTLGLSVFDPEQF
jgi:hypothetical protein